MKVQIGNWLLGDFPFIEGGQCSACLEADLWAPPLPDLMTVQVRKSRLALLRLMEAAAVLLDGEGPKHPHQLRGRGPGPGLACKGAGSAAKCKPGEVGVACSSVPCT